MTDNPSAFPVNAANLGGPGAYSPEPGMQLRDWFAGQALCGLLASTTRTASGHANIDGPGLARDTYAIADLMIAARSTAKVSGE